MKTTSFNFFTGVPAVAQEAIVGPVAGGSAAVVARESPYEKESARMPRDLARLTRPFGVYRAAVASGAHRPTTNKTLRMLAKLAAVGWPVKNAMVTVNAQAAYSQRANPPTLDSLQQCDPQALDEYKAYLVSHNAYAPDMALLCVDSRTYRRYHSPRFSEAETNCYGDAIGIAGRLNPSGVLHGDIHCCDALIVGALTDGAVHAENDRCPDNRRQMQFFLSQDRLDYHVISRGANDATWMNKFTGTPRFPVTIAGATVPQLSGGGITWIITDPQGEFKAHKEQPQDYPIHCPAMLCGLPEKPSDPKRDL